MDNAAKTLVLFTGRCSTVSKVEVFLYPGGTRTMIGVLELIFDVVLIILQIASAFTRLIIFTQRYIDIGKNNIVLGFSNGKLQGFITSLYKCTFTIQVLKNSF